MLAKSSEKSVAHTVPHTLLVHTSSRPLNLLKPSLRRTEPSAHGIAGGERERGERGRQGERGEEREERGVTYMLMRDAEGRKKQARSYKQQSN